MTADDSVLAAELALGLLDGEERAAALRRALAEPALAREVARWRKRFDGLLADVPAAEPEETAPPWTGSPPDRATLWRRWAVASTLIAASLALFAVLRPVAAPPAPQVVVPVSVVRLTAALSPAGGGTPFGAVYDAAAGELRLAAGVAVPRGRVAQLWRIGGDGVPRSLGLLSRAGPTSMVLADADRTALAPGITLAVSIEPDGGARGDKPTGPVVATGVLAPV